MYYCFIAAKKGYMWNDWHLNLPDIQTNRLQLVLNFAALLVLLLKRHKLNTSLIIKFLHWIKINKSIKYKVLSLTHKYLKTGQSSWVRTLLVFPSHRCTRSSSLITLSHPSPTSRHVIVNIYVYILLLFYGIFFHFIFIRLFITSLILQFQTHTCLIFNPLLSLRSWQPISLTLPFLFSLYLPRLYQDWYD